MKNDLFLEYLEHGDDPWRTRALTDRSYDYRVPECETNVTLATYGDALLKFTLCEILLDRFEELTIEKAKYESDVSLVHVAEHYDLIKYLRFDRNDPRYPQDYRTKKSQTGATKTQRSNVRAFNHRRKYIATAMEAILGAMYQAHRDLGEIRAVVLDWMKILEDTQNR
jgi:dsRNA-specific ribonuclease